MSEKLFVLTLTIESSTASGITAALMRVRQSILDESREDGGFAIVQAWGGRGGPFVSVVGEVKPPKGKP